MRDANRPRLFTDEAFMELMKLAYLAATPSIDIHNHEGKITPSDHKLDGDKYSEIMASLKEKYKDVNFTRVSWGSVAFGFINQGPSLVNCSPELRY